MWSPNTCQKKKKKERKKEKKREKNKELLDDYKEK